MSPKDDRVRLRHMLDAAQEACALSNGKQRTDLDSDHILELALTRLLEIVGEAAGRVSAETQARYTQIPWRQIIGLRNRLIHGYDAVDLDILWDILAHDRPNPVAQLKAILREG